MIYSEILQEKNRIQVKLSVESGSAHEYLIRSRLAAEEIARSYGFSFKYAELSENNKVSESPLKGKMQQDLKTVLSEIGKWLTSENGSEM